MVKFSVILPNYNHSKYLKKRIESIVNQTFSDFELIILDDCSSDDSRIIIEEYRDHPKVSVLLYNESNSGSTFLQWERGIKLANGEYIWLAESDDFADIHFLEEFNEIFEKNEGVGMAFCASNIIDQEDNVLHQNYQYGPEVNLLLSDNFVMDGLEFCERHLFFGCVLVNASAVVFRKNLFQNIQQDYKSYKVSGDWRMWVELCCQTKIAYLNNNLNYFRFHTNNVRTNKSDIMNREAIFNYLASLNKTDSEVVRNKLKKRLFIHWCFEFSRDVKHLQFSQSAELMRRIAKIDHYFFIRLVTHIIEKLIPVKIK